MKSILIYTMAIIFSVSAMQSQAIKDLSVGPAIMYKAGISAVNTPKGRKNGVAFNKLPDFGVSAYLPLSSTSNLGITTDIGYSSYSYIMKSAHTDTEYQLNHSYFTINPNFYFSGFIIGINLAIPMASDYDGTEIKTSIQNTMAELKIGGMIPIFKDDTGELNIVILGGYSLSGMYSDFVKNDPMRSLLPADEIRTDVFNPRAASLGIGFNFLFDLKSKPKTELNVY